MKVMQRKPTHPGEILLEEFAKPYGLTQKVLSKKLGTTIRTISELYNEKRGVSPEMALKLSRLFGTTPDLWTNLQKKYDLYRAYQKRKKEIEKVVPLKKHPPKSIQNKRGTSIKN